MKIIGICGSSGSGKSTVSHFFEEKGAVVLDCDKIYHSLINSPSACLDEIAANFGHDVVENGRLNRKKLSVIVFSDRDKLLLLNSISHRHVINHLEKEIECLKNKNTKACVIDAPMLYEANLDKSCDVVVAVIADESIKLDRIMIRDEIDLESAKKRLSNQISNEELKQRADFIIENNGCREELQMKCDDLLSKVLMF